MEKRKEKESRIAEMDAHGTQMQRYVATNELHERDTDKGSLSRARAGTQERRDYHRSYPPPPPLSVAVDLRRLSRRPVIAIVNRRFVA